MTRDSDPRGVIVWLLVADAIVIVLGGAVLAWWLS